MTDLGLITTICAGGYTPACVLPSPVGDFFIKHYIFIDMRKKQNPQKFKHLWI